MSSARKLGELKYTQKRKYVDKLDLKLIGLKLITMN